MAKKGNRVVPTDEQAIIDLLDAQVGSYAAEFQAGFPTYMFKKGGSTYRYSVHTQDITKDGKDFGNGITAMTTELGG